MPGQLPIIGKDAWRATVQGPFERSTVEQLNMPSEEIVIAGDWAFERHNETVVLVDRANGKRRRAHAKGIWILRRQADGSWKFARYIYNVSPSPEADTRLPYIETKPRSEEHI
jgi:ketosteroid isomerase-like protein